MELFTIDRTSGLRPGMTCSLTEYRDIKPVEVAEIIREMCPGGVSRHGKMYLVEGTQTSTLSDATTEMLFEWVRRAKFPDRPSRYQCIFAVDSLSSANTFMQEMGVTGAPIFRVVPNTEPFRADMRLLDAKMSAAVNVYFASLYWQGLPHPAGSSFWEWLVPCPAIIGEQIG